MRLWFPDSSLGLSDKVNLLRCKQSSTRLLRTTTGFVIYLRHILMARLYQLTKLKFETIRRVWATCRMGNGVLAEASKTRVKQVSFTRFFPGFFPASFNRKTYSI